jgi:hypothetical protein
MNGDARQATSQNSRDTQKEAKWIRTLIECQSRYEDDYWKPNHLGNNMTIYETKFVFILLLWIIMIGWEGWEGKWGDFVVKVWWTFNGNSISIYRLFLIWKSHFLRGWWVSRGETWKSRLNALLVLWLSVLNWEFMNWRKGCFVSDGRIWTRICLIWEFNVWEHESFSHRKASKSSEHWSICHS